jgi:molecular chaperone GrpE
MPENKDWETFIEDATDDHPAVEQDLTSPEAEEPSPEAPSPANAQASGDPAALAAALDQAEQMANDNWEKMLRLKSELENSRRRAARDLENVHKYSLEKFTQELLPVVDSLEQALDNNEAEAEHLEGIKLTHKMLLDALSKFAIVAINPVGERFDPNIHEAMSMLESADVEPGHIVAVFQKGYLLSERVVRPARVIVAKAAASET